MPDQLTSTKTRTFKGVDIGVMIFGLIAAGGLAYAVVQMTGEGGGGGGGSTTTQTSTQSTTSQPKAIALTGTSVLFAFSAMDARQTFSAVNYYSGSTLVANQPSEYGTNQGIAATANQVLSIRSAGQTGLPGQMINLAYSVLGSTDPKYLTVCLGETKASTVYIATDGSTFTDSALKKRTTNQSCSQITAKSLRANRIQRVEVASTTSWHSQIDGSGINLQRDSSPMAVIDSGESGTGDYSPTEDLTPFGNPLTAQTVVRSGFTQATIQQTLIAITYNQTQKSTLCFPQTSFSSGADTPRYFYDQNGTPFKNIFLTQMAMSETCPALIQRSLHISQADNGTISSQGEWPLGGILYVAMNQWEIAATNGLSGETLDMYNAGAPADESHLVFPVSVRSEGSGIGDATIPTTQLEITGAGQTYNLCYPQSVLGPIIAGTNNSVGPKYFYSTAGMPYSDILLTKAVPCSAS